MGIEPVGNTVASGTSQEMGLDYAWSMVAKNEEIQKDGS